VAAVSPFRAPIGGGPVPFSLHFTALADLGGAAINNLQATAKADSIDPESFLGQWVALLKKGSDAFRMTEEERDAQFRAVFEGGLVPTWRNAASTGAGMREAGPFDAAVKRQMAQAQNRTIETLGAATFAGTRAAFASRVGAYEWGFYRWLFLTCTVTSGLMFACYSSGVFDRCRDLSRKRQVNFYDVAHGWSGPSGREAGLTLPSMAALLPENVEAQEPALAAVKWLS